MRAMKDSGIAWIGEIPADWTKTRIGNLFRFSSGDSLTNEEIQDEGLYKVYGANGPRGYYHHSNLAGKHILIGRVGALCGNVHVVNEAVWATEHALIAEQISSNIYTDFAARVFESMNLGQYSKASAQPVIASSVVQRLQIPIPPFSEQHRIADYLDRKCSQIDAIIARQQEVIEKLKAYKLSVITEAVTKGLNPDVPMKDSGIPWLGNICNHYALSRVGAFCFVTKLAGFEYTDIMSSAISDTGEVPIVRAQNVRMFNFNDNIDEYIGLDVSQKLDRCTLNKKCLLITFIGAGIGDVCVFSKAMRYHLAPNVAKIEIRDEYKTILDEEYLMFYLGSLAGKGEISKISKASAQPSLSMGTIRGITIAVPPIDEQRKISEYLSRKIAFIDKVVRGKESIIENLLAYKNSLIYEIVTGKKEV